MMTVFAQSVHFAGRAHVHQKRKYTGAPYFTHCKEVARLVAMRTDDQEVWAAAALHDVLEDTSTSFQTLRSEFGDRIAGIVLELTDEFTKEKYPGWNRAKRKYCEAMRLGQVSDEAKLIKLCDLIDNTSSIISYDPSFAVVYFREAADLLEQMGYGRK